MGLFQQLEVTFTEGPDTRPRVQNHIVSIAITSPLVNVDINISRSAESPGDVVVDIAAISKLFIPATQRCGLVRPLSRFSTTSYFCGFYLDTDLAYNLVMVRGWPIDLSYSKNSASPNFHGEPLKFCSSSLLIKGSINLCRSCFVLPRKVDGFDGKRIKHQRRYLRSFLPGVVLASRFNQSSVSVHRPGGSLKKWTWLCQVSRAWHRIWHTLNLMCGMQK